MTVKQLTIAACFFCLILQEVEKKAAAVRDAARQKAAEKNVLKVAVHFCLRLG